MTKPITDETLFKLVEAALAEVAGSKFDYACFHLYRAQGEKAFYGVNLHSENAVRHGNGPSIKWALSNALAREPHTAVVDIAA
jgi:hypothetical protein